MGSKVMDGTKRARLREKKFVFKIFLADRKIIKPDFNSQLVTFLSKIIFFLFSLVILQKLRSKVNFLENAILKNGRY